MIRDRDNVPTATEAIRNYLTAKLPTHPGRDLVERYLAAGGPHAMETQANVGAGIGEAVAGKRSTWSDGIDTWFSIRIPHNAFGDPEFRDYNLPFILDEHIEGIGSTGWNWRDRQSIYVAFDFDSITGHAAGVGISKEELEKVREAACRLPYVESRRSTGGKGLHLYVFLAGIPTANHTEHAALARCILGMMSSEAGFDFASAIDCCGGVLWLWHRKLADNGLKLIKASEKTLAEADLPVNWRDHVEVVTRRRAKVKVGGVADQDEDPFEKLASARKIIPLDASHKAQIDWLLASGFSTIWVADHHLLQTHTRALANMLEDPQAKAKFRLQGVFQTLSEGRDPGTCNCFLFPLSHGGWKVYRFSPGVPEAPTWTQDGERWTACYFNRKPDLPTAAKAHGGLLDPDQRAYLFDTAMSACTAAEALGARVQIPDRLVNRQSRLRLSKGGSLVFEIAREKDDAVTGWVRKSQWWVRDLSHRVKEPADENRSDIVRALVTPRGESAGLLIRQKDGQWVRHPAANVKMALQSIEIPKTAAEQEIGDAILDPYKRVWLPFEDDWLPGRLCNIDAPQLKVSPREGDHPHWDLVFNHTGQGLTDALQRYSWFRDNAITTGGDYLRCWVACMMRDPFEPLPFLATVGEEDSGKSILYEAIRDNLFTRGVVSGNYSLTNDSGFNGEMEGALLVAIEEINLASYRHALSRLKEWTTAKVLPIRRMRTDLYHVPNTCHFYFCCNRLDYIPAMPGDTRIVVCWVDRPVKPIPKPDLMAKLEDEAPAMLWTLKHLELPKPNGRLRLPLIETAEKDDVMDQQSPISSFLKECCLVKTGERVTKAEAYTVYKKWCQVHGFKPQASNVFGARIMDLTCRRVRAGKYRDGDDQRHVYLNLYLTPAAIRQYLPGGDLLAL
jgi:hypothetical protein